MSAGSGGPSKQWTQGTVRERWALWLRLRFGVQPRTVLAVTVVLLLAVGLAGQHFWSGRPRGVAAPPGAPVVAGPQKSSRPGTIPGGGPQGRRVVVDIAGKVRDPGVHRLPPGSRVEDALAAAGGPRRGAALAGLNRARVLVDGEQIVVGGSGAPAGGAQAPGPQAPGGPASGAPAAGGAPGVPGGRISLSSATAEQLDSLPGVGPVLAQRIIEYRTQHGGFTSIEDLRRVDGIGDSRFADIKPQVGP